MSSFAAGIDDVQDFTPEDGEGSSTWWERYNTVYDLMQTGNKAFRENRLYQVAWNCWDHFPHIGTAAEK
ncbi:hypothetical protein OROGR_032440 [Orobanche gracilis]